MLGADGTYRHLREDRTVVTLYWIPLGAGGHFVHFNGKVFEALVAMREHRSPCELYHAALTVDLDGDRYTIELAPSPDGNTTARGVVGTGPVGSRRLGRLRLFRYEVRCWRNGSIPDLAFAVAPPVQLGDQRPVARRVLELVGQAPTPVWGRDELGAGEMWNSNSLISWLLAETGLASGVLPPDGGRAPGWSAGLAVAGRALPTALANRG